MNSTVRQGLFSIGAALLAVVSSGGLSACGKKQSADPAADGIQHPAPAEEKVLNVYNWSDYIAPDTIANFEKEYGIKVNYDMFDSNEVLETKLLAGRSGYDVVVPSASFLERQIKAGVFQKLDAAKLSNLKNMDPEIQQRVALHDPGNAHSVNYMWGTTGIGYNAAKVAKVLNGAPIDSWALVLDPNNAAKLKSCGLTILDDPGEVTAIVLNYLGKNPNSSAPEDLAAAEAVLMKIRPFVRQVNSSQYINDLANGDVCVAVGYSGDILQARDRAAEANSGVTVAYSVPKEGTVIWFDMLAIPGDAPHPNNAHLFINYLLRPEVIAAVSNKMNYANGNAASLTAVNDAVKNDPGVYPPPDVRAKLFPDLAKSADYTRLMNRTWTRFKTGK